MNRLGIVPATWPRSAVVVVVVAVGLVLAGCTSGGASSSSSGGTPSTGASGSSPGSGGGGGGTVPVLFPAVVGDTWVYIDKLAGTERGTTTNAITAVAPAAGGKRVTISTRSNIAGLPATSSRLIYMFHSDGSISVPLAQVGNGSVVIKSGSIVWPPQSVLDSGQPHKSTLVVQIKAVGHSLTAKADVTVQGAGTQSVTVPAGTYRATVVNETIAEQVEGISVTIDVRTWLAPGVGPVKSQASTKEGTVSQIVSVEELKSFIKG
jgi:hypothetical protein